MYMHLDLVLVKRTGGEAVREPITKEESKDQMQMSPKVFVPSPSYPASIMSQSRQVMLP